MEEGCLAPAPHLLTLATCTPASNTGNLYPNFQPALAPQLAHASTLKVKWRFGAYKLTRNTNPDTGVPVLQLSAIHPTETNPKGQ